MDLGAGVRKLTFGALAVSSFFACASVASAQQVTGTLGSADATTTIDGKQLPPPPPKFGGVIKDKRQRFDALVAAARGASQGRAERAAHHDR